MSREYALVLNYQHFLLYTGCRLRLRDECQSKHCTNSTSIDGLCSTFFWPASPQCEFPVARNKFFILCLLITSSSIYRWSTSDELKTIFCPLPSSLLSMLFNQRLFPSYIAVLCDNQPILLFYHPSINLTIT